MADLRTIEDRVTAALAGSWRGDVEALRRDLIAAHAAGNLTRSQVERLLASLTVPDPATVAVAVALLRPAARFGNATVVGKTRAVLAKPAVTAIRDAVKHPRRAIVEAGRRLAVADVTSLPQLLGVLAPLSGSASTLEGAASWATHYASNAAVVEAAAQTGEKLVFVAERDACVICQGYAGETQTDAGFGGGASFLGGVVSVIPQPPVHPRCRCTVETYDDPNVPLTLKREAVRSVLRGFSLPSESESQRIKAAENALRRNLAAPASVKKYARDNIRRGKFRTRQVPSGK